METSSTTTAITIEFEAYPSMEWPTSLDIPLKASEELVSIDLETDLPEDPNDLRTLLVEESSDKEHWITIAVAYSNQGKLQDGIRLIMMALDVFTGSDKANLHTFLTWAYLRLAKENDIDPKAKEENLQKAENHLKDAISFNPTWISNILATLDLYYQRGHYDKALETSELFIKGIQAEERRSGKQSRPNCMFLFLRAKLLFKKKNYNTSLKCFQELLVSNPSLKPDPRIGIGMCFWQLNDSKMAIKSWNRAAELDPKNKSASLLVLLSKFHTALSKSENDQAFKESFTNALQNLDEYLTEDKENPVLLALLQSYYYFKGEYQSIIDIYEKKIINRKDLISNTVLSELTFWCGRAYFALNDYRRAFTMFQESLRKNEDNILAKFGIGQSQLKTKLVEESILTFENLLKTHENIQELNYILGLLYAGKCLDPANKKSLSNKSMTSVTNKAIQFLERYVNLTTAMKNQLVTPRAYLVLSELYEIQSGYKQSLDYLTDAIEELKFINKDDIPMEIYNNLGCYYFISGETDKAKEYFKKAQDDNQDKNLKMSIDFNIARFEEDEDVETSMGVYQSILSEHPHYLAAKIRNLYCKYIKSTTANVEDEDEVMTQLLSENESNLEIRSFYSWYLKNVRKDDNLETAHNRDTLVKYDSHDLYALVSLANLYTVIARENIKSSSKKEQEKSKNSYLKAIQLYQKVLQIDPLNVFAAQGIAIIFAEHKRMGAALEILRKVRDSIKNEDIHINLGNCLLEMNEYVKAIETFELLLKNFDNLKNKAHILNLLGRAWYSRGMKEKNVTHMKRALDYVKAAIESQQAEALENNTLTDLKNIKFISILKFNLAFLDFQIAETLRRSSVKNRSIDDLKQAVLDLENGIVILKELKEIKDFNIIPDEETEQRIQLGETTMMSSLKRCISEQEVYDKESNEKLVEARKLLQEQEAEEEKKLEKEEEEKRIKLEKQAEEYNKLQDEAQKLIQERDSMIVNDDEVSDGDFADEDKKKRKRKASGEPSIKKQKKKKAKTGQDEDDDDAIAVTKHRGKKSALSDEFIVDSEDDEEEPVYDEGSDNKEEVHNSGNDDEDGLF